MQLALKQDLVGERGYEREDIKKWLSDIREIKRVYDIRVTIQPQKVSAKRVAILVGESFLIHVSNSMHRMPKLQQEVYEAALANGLHCDPLERETPKRKDGWDVLAIWNDYDLSGEKQSILLTLALQELLREGEPDERKSVSKADKRTRFVGAARNQKAGIRQIKSRRTALH